MIITRFFIGDYNQFTDVPRAYWYWSECLLFRISSRNHSQCWDKHIDVSYEEGGWIDDVGKGLRFWWGAKTFCTTPCHRMGYSQQLAFSSLSIPPHLAFNAFTKNHRLRCLGREPNVDFLLCYILAYLVSSTTWCLNVLGLVMGSAHGNILGFTGKSTTLGSAPPPRVRELGLAYKYSLLRAFEATVIRPSRMNIVQKLHTYSIKHSTVSSLNAATSKLVVVELWWGSFFGSWFSVSSYSHLNPCNPNPRRWCTAQCGALPSESSRPGSGSQVTRKMIK